MPQIGDVQHGATSSVRWNGSRWETIPNGPPEQPGTAGLFSGGLSKLADPSTVSDLWHGATEHPIDTLKGFFHGAAEGLPAAAKIAQVAAPFVTGGASIPAQMAVGGGTQILSDLADRAAGDPDAPQTFGSAVGRGVVGAAIPGAMSGIYRGAQAAGRVIKMLPEDVSGGVTGGLVGGYEGYKHGGVGGALLGAATGAAGGSYGANRLATVIKGLRGASTLAPEIETEGAQFASRMKPRSAEVPGSSYRPSVTPEPEMPLPRSSYADLDPHMPNTSSHASVPIPEQEPLPQSSYADVDRYMPNTSTSSGKSAAVDDAIEGLTQAAEAEAPKPAAADEFVPSATKLPNQPLRSTFGSDVAPEARVDAAVEGMTPPPEPTNARILPRDDDAWGPGSLNGNGDLATQTANLRTDPQESTDSLREALRAETDPVAKQAKLKDLRQRMRVDAYYANLRGGTE